MKKGEIYEGKVERVKFPNKGMVRAGGGLGAGEGGGEVVLVKGVLPGQMVSFVVSKKRGGRVEGRLLEVVEKSPAELDAACCPHFGACGGCSYQTLPYGEQLGLKVAQIEELLKPVIMTEYATEAPKTGDSDDQECHSERLADCGGDEMSHMGACVGSDGASAVWQDIFEGILPSPRQFEYRNKMEFTFGDEVKGGPLTLGLHRRGSMHDIIPVVQCRIVDGDFRKILTATMEYFREIGAAFYHRMRHEGYLRHLLVRKAVRTGEILVDLVTTTQTGLLPGNMENKENLYNHADTDGGLIGDIKKGENIPGSVGAASSTNATAETAGNIKVATDENGNGMEDEVIRGWVDALLSLDLEGTLTGILHTKNDSLSDAVKDEGTEVLYGQDYFFEELLGLRFRITPFSFFQTNSLGAEVLYDTARRFIRESLTAAGESLSGRTVFDLYSGTGTIAQMLAPVAGKVIGVEIVGEAVEAARENAALNGLSNCEFIAGDVLKVLDEIGERPDFIVLDPPRDGIHPKALKKIIAYGVERMVYISCKPTSLARDLAVLQEAGYRAERICCVDLFPGTPHVETVVLMSSIRNV